MQTSKSSPAFALNRSWTWIRRDSTRLGPCSMAGKRFLSVVCIGLVALCGCKAIRGVRLEPSQSLALTADEAQALRAEGLQLFGEQPRNLVRVTRAALVLEQAARTLRDDYDAQWQAAQAL